MTKAAAYAALLAALLLAAPAAADKLAPTYVIEAIKIRGNTKTKEHIIRRALRVSAGERLSVDDRRFEISRYRVLSLGFFSDVRLKLEKGTSRGKVNLVVSVEERGTILLTDIFFGSSEATTAWGGLGIAENNFLGRGLGLHGAFVIGSEPEVGDSSVQAAFRLGVRTPRLAGGPISAHATFNYLSGSDFFRTSGRHSSSSPDHFVAVPYKRVGAMLGVGFDLGRYTQMYLDYRGELVNADVPPAAVRVDPSGVGQPVTFGISDGDSVLSLVAVTIERDTRSDPVLPQRGSLLSLTGEFSSGLIGSGYDYFKLKALYRQYLPLTWGHVLSFNVGGGVVFGKAPFFEKFFVGDFNDLVPSRALGLNFSTLPSRDIFGTAISSKRYEEFAVRASMEYIVPWFRGGRFFYGGDFFVDVGLIMLTSRKELQVRDQDLSGSIPIDMTLDAGLRLDTRVGVFRLSIGNGLGRIPF